MKYPTTMPSTPSTSSPHSNPYRTWLRLIKKRWRRDMLLDAIVRQWNDQRTIPKHMQKYMDPIRLELPGPNDPMCRLVVTEVATEAVNNDSTATCTCPGGPGGPGGGSARAVRRIVRRVVRPQLYTCRGVPQLLAMGRCPMTRGVIHRIVCATPCEYAAYRGLIASEGALQDPLVRKHRCRRVQKELQVRVRLYNMRRQYQRRAWQRLRQHVHRRYGCSPAALRRMRRIQLLDWSILTPSPSPSPSHGHELSTAESDALDVGLHALIGPSLYSLVLSNNDIDGNARVLEHTLRSFDDGDATSLIHLALTRNQLLTRAACADVLVTYLRTHTCPANTLTALDLSSNVVGEQPVDPVFLERMVPLFHDDLIPHLTELSLQGNRLDACCGPALAHCLLDNATLTRVNLSRNRLGCGDDRGLQALSAGLGTMRVLTGLNLQDNHLRANGLRMLVEALDQPATPPPIIELDIACNDLCNRKETMNDGIRALRGSSMIHRIVRLHMHTNQLSATSSQLLFTNPHPFHSVRFLDITNHIFHVGRDVGASRCIGRALNDMPFLETLVITHRCRLTKDATTLDLSGMQLHAGDAIVLASWLCAFTRGTLRTLRLRDNPAIGEWVYPAGWSRPLLSRTYVHCDGRCSSEDPSTPDGLTALVKAIADHPTLTTLDLQNTGVAGYHDEQGVHALATMLILNTTLRRIDLTGNDLDNECIQVLHHADMDATYADTSNDAITIRRTRGGYNDRLVF